MPTTRSPRHGSMQFWPRKRARRIYPRVRAWAECDKAQLLGFAGYKVGMTTVIIPDERKHIKGKVRGELAIPVTIIECPPLKIASIRLYKKDAYGLKLAREILGKLDKEMARKLRLPKKEPRIEGIRPDEYSDIRVNAYTQPRLTGLGKKKPELFELAIGGTLEEKWNFAKENLGKEVFCNQVVEPGQQVDIHAVTKGKGFQGPVKRFGIGLTSHKAEKARRNPGSLGGWKAQGHFMYRIAHAGQMGFHTRTEHNKLVMKVSLDSEGINAAGGFVNYGLVKNPYILLKGSIPGPKKRLVRFNIATRPSKKIQTGTNIKHVSRISQQR